MNTVKKFKLHFFSIDIKKDSLFSDKKIDPLDLLVSQLKNTTKPKNVYDINGYKAFVKHISDDFFCFEKHRINDLPAVGSVNNNKERNLDLDDGETLIEKNYFYINRELNYIIFQEKQEGFRATSLGFYFRSLLDAKTNTINILQILQKSTYERLLKYGYVKSLDITFTSPSYRLLQKCGVSLNESILYRKNKHLNLNIKLSLPQKESVGQSFLNKWKKMRDDNPDEISSLKIRGSETSKDNLRDINIAKDIIEVEATVKITNNHIDEEGIISELNRASDVYHDEIREILND